MKTRENINMPIIRILKPGMAEYACKPNYLGDECRRVTVQGQPA
jgi:hypothetical protein